MSADGSVRLDWAGEERKFRLGIGQLRELQENVNRPRAAMGAPLIGPFALINLLAAFDAWPDEVREIIRLGLIGGGMAIDRVPALVKRYVDDRPLVESTMVAQAILLVAIKGVPEDPVGKKPDGETDEQTTSSASPPSMEPDVPSDSVHDKSTSSPSGSLPPVSTASTKRTARTTNPRP